MPRSVQIYTWGLASAGLVMSCLALAFLPFPSLLPTLILAVAAATFERFTMTLPNRASFSLGSTFVLLAYGAHGPVAALLVELAAVAIAVVKAKRPVQKAFNFGQLLVSLTGMYLVTEALGGTGELLSVRTTVNLLIGGLAFFATNTCLISVVFALLQQRRYVWVFVEMVTESYVGIIGSLVLLPPFLYAFGVGGWPTLALLCGALLAFRYAVNLYLEQKRVHLEALGQLSTLLERKNGAQESHASRVAALARAAAEALKLSADDVDTIHTAAILHDIGEAELDARVVSVKVRRVIATLADAAEYRRHAELGEALVSKIGGLSAPARLIRHHHEAWDGSGYPDGLRGQAIPLGARILGAAEAIEESGAESIDDKLAVIEKLAGTVIDPALTCVLATAVRKVNKPTARAGAMMQEPEVSMLQGKVLESVRGSELLRTIGVGHLLMFHGDGFTDFIGEPAVPPVADEVQRMAEQAVRSQLPVRQHVVHGSKAFDVYCIPAGYESASVLVFDVTKALAVEREQTRRIWKAYRDVMSVATGGKLVLVDSEESSALLAEGEVRGHLELRHPEDGAVARSLVGTVLREEGFDQAEAFRLRVCVSESVTNVFKHAGKGTVTLRRTPEALRIVVADSGSGIPYDILPKAVLADGYSTQHSLGKGYSVMLRYMDRIYLGTSSQGTTVILERRAGGEPAQPENSQPGTGEGGRQVC